MVSSRLACPPLDDPAADKSSLSAAARPAATARCGWLTLRSEPDALTLGPDGDVRYVSGNEGPVGRVRGA